MALSILNFRVGAALLGAESIRRSGPIEIKLADFRMDPRGEEEEKSFLEPRRICLLLRNLLFEKGDVISF